MNLLKHKETTYQNSKNPTSNLDSPKENIKENIKESIYTLPDFIKKETWDNFLELRLKMKAAPTEHAKGLLIKKLEELRSAGNDPNLVLEQSTMNNWKGLILLKNEQTGGKHDVHPKYIIE